MLKPLSLTFEGEGGYGWLGLGKNFFLQTSRDRIFSLTYNSARLFFQYDTPWEIFFSVQELFSPRYFLARFFPPWNQSAGYFFPKSPIIVMRTAVVSGLKQGKKNHMIILVWNRKQGQSFRMNATCTPHWIFSRSIRNVIPISPSAAHFPRARSKSVLIYMYLYCLWL